MLLERQIGTKLTQIRHVHVFRDLRVVLCRRLWADRRHWVRFLGRRATSHH